MPYIFSPADVNADSAGFANMKALRESFEPMFVSVTKSKQLVNAEGTVLGKVTWVKALKHEGYSVPMVQPDDERPSLEDVLASIDELELEDTPAAVDADDTVDGHDDEDDTHEPVTFPVNSDEDIDAIVDWQMRGHEDDIITTTPHPGTMGMPAPAPAPRVARTRHARMSHKNCGHAITGQAGKEARAACRAAHRAAAASAA